MSRYECLAGETEILGELMEGRVISKDEATQRLTEYSDGGLTRRGAADLLGDWRNVRARYERSLRP